MQFPDIGKLNAWHQGQVSRQHVLKQRIDIYRKRANILTASNKVVNKIISTDFE